MSKATKPEPVAKEAVETRYAKSTLVYSNLDPKLITDEDIARVGELFRRQVDGALFGGAMGTVYDCQDNTHLFEEGAAVCKCGKVTL